MIHRKVGDESEIVRKTSIRRRVPASNTHPLMSERGESAAGDTRRRAVYKQIPIFLLACRWCRRWIRGQDQKKL